MTGSSTTLTQIGFVDLLKKGSHPWDNWKDHILNEENAERRHTLRRTSTTADFFQGSVQAITRDGLVVSCDATGSRQGGYVYGAKAVIWVVGLNKLVPDLDTALRRVREYCLPLEDAAMKRSGGSGSHVGKLVLYEREGQPCRIRTILVREALGY